MDIDIEKEFEQLQPSQDLLEYYRKKILKFDNDHEAMLELLQKYKNDFDTGEFVKEKEQMRNELIDLRSALSDINIFLHSERQQVQKLHFKNEQLKLELYEAEKKIALLLSLSEISEGDLMVFLRKPRNLTILKQKLPPQAKKYLEELKRSSSNISLPESELILQKKIEQLEDYCNKSEKNWISEKSVLLQDRTLCNEEAKVQQAKDEAHIKLLNARLEEVKIHLYDANEKLIKNASQHRESEKQWLAEKDHYLTQLKKFKEKIAFSKHIEVVQRSGSYIDLDKLTEAKNTCELKDLRRDNSILKKQLSEANELKILYESQNIKLEQQMCKLREKLSTTEELLKERRNKHSNQVKLLQSQINKQNERQKVDNYGFHSELKILKNNLKIVIQQLYKIINVYSGHVEMNPKLISVDDSKAVADLSRSVQLAISDMKRHILKLETELAKEEKESTEWRF